MFDAIGVPHRPPALRIEILVDKMKMDKKASGDMLTVPVPTRLGEPVLERLSFAALSELVSEFPI